MLELNNLNLFLDALARGLFFLFSYMRFWWRLN